VVFCLHEAIDLQIIRLQAKASEGPAQSVPASSGLCALQESAGGQVRGAFEYDEFDDDLDEGPEDIPVCPECGSDDLTIVGEGQYVCEDCGERFVEGEEDA
jgi:hypothetical protein